MESSGAEEGRLVLLVDDDVESRRHARRLLELHGMEVVQASNGIAALELIQRLPRSFRLVVTDLVLPGISGAVVLGVLRLFRPDLAVLCLDASRKGASTALTASGCLGKPLQSSELHAAIEAALGSGGKDWEPRLTDGWSEMAEARARARFAVGKDLVEAALELARSADRGT